MKCPYCGKPNFVPDRAFINKEFVEFLKECKKEYLNEKYTDEQTTAIVIEKFTAKIAELEAEK